MLKKGVIATRSWIVCHPWRFISLSLGILLATVIIFQFLYPADKLLPFASIDKVSLSGWSKADAIKNLDSQLNGSQISVYFNNSDSPFFKATPGDLGITLSNEARVQAIEYAWYWRLIPSSILWGHFVTDNSVGKLNFQRNQDVLRASVGKRFGETCRMEPQNATLQVKDDTIMVVESQAGGDCDFEELIAQLMLLKPAIEGVKTTIAGKEIAPAVATSFAEDYAKHATKVVQGGIGINDGRKIYDIDRATLLNWIEFTTANGKLDYSFSVERAKDRLGEQIGKAVSKPGGVTTVTTHDFQEIARVPGQSGVALDEVAMLASIKTSLEKGEKEVAVDMKITPPTIKYNRNYSPTDAGLSALMQNYAETHPGTYAVSLKELTGARRNASYRASTQYTTASTYKLFVAYSVLLRIESGAWQWGDQMTGGRDVTQCLDDMIVKSDNACAETMLKKIGYKEVTNEAKALGFVNTSFLGSNGIKSTAEDEALFLSLLHTGQLLSQQSSRNTLINAMKRNIFRQGIPKGLPSITVANKPGFLNGWLHDASIVYTPGGDVYVLVILTEGASWANIAALSGQIETLRTSGT